MRYIRLHNYGQPACPDCIKEVSNSASGYSPAPIVSLSKPHDRQARPLHRTLVLVKHAKGLWNFPR